MLALLRLRFKLTVHARRERLLLAEEAALVAIAGGQDRRAWMARLARLLRDAGQLRSRAPARERLVRAAQEDLPALLDGPLADHARRRASELLADHARLRAAAAGVSRVTVEAVLPPDVIGLFVLMPAEA